MRRDMRARYQRGCLKNVPRKSGSVWEYRYRLNGQQKTMVVGSLKELKTESAAWKKLELIRLNLNSETHPTEGPAMKFETLALHYQDKEMPLLINTAKAFSSKDTDRGYIKKWIIPHWGEYRLTEVRTTAIEDWLGGLSLANGSKAKIRNIMSVIYRHAMRHGFTDKNPVALVRQSAKRQRIPDVLTVDEIRALLGVLRLRERTMILMVAGSGIRRGELFGLTWGDIDFAERKVLISRSIVKQHVGPVKTEASKKQLPLDEYMLADLLTWYSVTPYKHDDHYVFATDSNRAGDMRGKQPCWPNKVWDYWIKPKLAEAKITKRVNWHTFRHSYSTLLKSNGEDIKTVQELLRHSSSRVTMDVYTQAIDSKKRDAQSKVVQMYRTASA